MAAFIDSDVRSVVDVGCGPMWLREYISPEVSYTGIDYVNRGEGVVVCDLNRQTLPPINADVWFVSGCLEYLENPELFISGVARQARTCILSYCDLRDFPSPRQRTARGWKNHLTCDDITRYFEGNGMLRIECVRVPSGDSILVFARQPL